MSESSTLRRPRQVTLAAWMIIGGSVLVVLAVFERVATLHRLETQDAMRRVLAEPPLSGLGLDLELATTILRTVSMVAAGCAAAAAILGFHVLKRNRAARLALTVLAVPIFLSGLVVGGFLSSLVAVSAVLLWMAPARDWFNGIAPSRPSREERSATPTVPPPTPPPTSGPRPHQGFGSVPPPGGGSAPPENAPYPPPTYAPPPPGARPYAAPPPGSPPYSAAWPAPGSRTAKRPAALVTACVITWVCSSLALLMMAVSAIAIAADPDRLLAELNRQNPELVDPGMTAESLANLTYTMAGLLGVWSVAAIVVAVLAFRRSQVARIVLMASAGGAAGLCLLASFQVAPMIVPLFACVITFSLLLRPDVRAWFAAP